MDISGIDGFCPIISPNAEVLDAHYLDIDIQNLLHMIIALI